MWKWLMMAMLTLTLAACNMGAEEAVDQIEEDTTDLVLPNDDDRREINGGSGENNMNGAGGTNGDPGNNVINEGVNNDMGGTSGTGTGIPPANDNTPMVDNDGNVIEDEKDRHDTNHVGE